MTAAGSNACVHLVGARWTQVSSAHLVADDERAAQRSALRSLIGALEHRRAVLATQPSPGEIEFAIEALRATLAFEEVLYHKPADASLHGPSRDLAIWQRAGWRDGPAGGVVRGPLLP
ncbi:MAG: hypothetical protein U1E76_15445 [Planctomycetota bacterium]